MTPTADALAAANYYATVWVSNADSGLNLSANILGNISEQHGMVLSTLDEIGVVPGETQTVDFSLVNNGNLVENVVIETSVFDDWSVTPASIPLTLDVGETYSDSFVVDVPSLGDDDSMLNGAIYPVTMRVLNATTQDELEVHRFNFIVAPLFIVEVEDWPTSMDYHRRYQQGLGRPPHQHRKQGRGSQHHLCAFQGGLTTPSTDWEISNNAPSTLLLRRGIPEDLTFTIRSVAIEPPLTLVANLVVTLEPVEEAVQGSAEYYTDLRMNRFFEQGDTAVTPPTDNGAQTFPITYSHIPLDLKMPWPTNSNFAVPSDCWMSTIWAKTPRSTSGRLLFGLTTPTTPSTCPPTAVPPRLEPIQESRYQVDSLGLSNPIQLIIDTPTPLHLVR